MRKLLILLLLTACGASLISSVSEAQVPAVGTTSFTMTVATAPPAVVTNQTFSNSSSTGATTSATGGTVAAGTYRICVTYFTSSNTETPCSTDTAATSTITTTGSTSTVTVYPPVVALTGAGNIVGYRVYVGANGGAAAAETLQTLNSSVCTLSTSSTASCALSSQATFTASTNFSAGSGGPASPGTAIYPPINNAAATALFENSVFPTHILSWSVSGTAPGTCTVQLQTGTAPGTLANVGQSLTCTATGSYSLPIYTAAAYGAINVSAFTAGGTNTAVTFTLTDFPFILPFAWGPATPTGNCTNGASFTSLGAASASTVVYVCQPANTWSAITVP